MIEEIALELTLFTLKYTKLGKNIMKNFVERVDISEK